MDAEEYSEYLSWITNIYGIVVSVAVYSVVVVFGLVGNLLIGYSVLKHKSRQTVTNVFIFNLAVVNLLICLFYIPIYTVKLIVRDVWPFGYLMCHLWPFSHYLVFFTPNLILVVVAVNRYSTVVHPLREMMKTRNVIIVIVTIWLVSIAASSPYGFFIKYFQHTVGENNELVFVCGWVLQYRSAHNIYDLSTSIILLVIPLIVTASIYIALSIKMSTPDRTPQLADNRRTNRLLIAMATVFYICTMPQHIFGQILHYDYEIIHWKYLIIILRVFSFLALSSTCSTPLFYVWINKITFKQFCLVGPCCKHQSIQSTNVDGINSKVPENEDRPNAATYSALCDTIDLLSVNRDG